MNTSRIARSTLVAALALGIGTAPAWADGYRDHDGFGPAAAIVGLAAAAIAAPYVFGSAQVVVPAPVYAPPPVVYAPQPAYVYSPAPVYAPAPRYGWHDDRRDHGWHRGWHRGWHHDDDDDR